MKKLVIFDVCNTIVDTNSTFSYVDFLINKWVKPWYKTLFHNRLLWYLYILLYSLFKFNFKIFLIKKYFKWLDVNKIKSLSWEYFERYNSRIFPNILKIINHEKKLSKVILLSSSINPPIDFLKEKFWIEWFSSTLEEKDGKYTWRVLQSLWWKKELLFKEWKINLDKYKKIELYTDNLDDVWLIKFLNAYWDFFVYIIIHHNRKYWNKFFSINNINHEFIG